MRERTVLVMEMLGTQTMQMKFQFPFTNAMVRVYWWTKREPRRRGEESRHTTYCKIRDPHAGEFIGKTYKHPDDAHDQTEGCFVSLCRAAKQYITHFSQNGVRGQLKTLVWTAWAEHVKTQKSSQKHRDITYVRRFLDAFCPRPKKSAVPTLAETGADWNSYAPIANPDFIQETVPPPDAYKRLCQRVKELEDAIAPFARFYEIVQEDTFDNSVLNERIKDWFERKDFRNAARAWKGGKG